MKNLTLLVNYYFNLYFIPLKNIYIYEMNFNMALHKKNSLLLFIIQLP